MKKHAYCIIAHDDPYCLNTLIRLIDDNRNDIILVRDKKTPESLFKDIKPKYSTLLLPPPIELIDIQWGSLSQVKAELLCFKTATQYKEYAYLHLISGVDLPLKTQDYIHHYFDSLPTGSNLIGFAQSNNNKADLLNKTYYYHPFTNYYKHPNKIIRITLFLFRKLMVNFQKSFHIKRNWGKFELYKGANWVSISGEFAKYLVNNENEILQLFKGVPCADEIYKQSMIMDSKFNNTIIDIHKDFANLTRKIDWSRGKPYVWHYSDFDELIKSDALFARKFSSKIDKKIIDQLSTHILKEQNKI